MMNARLLIAASIFLFLFPGSAWSADSAIAPLTMTEARTFSILSYETGTLSPPAGSLPGPGQTSKAQEQVPSLGSYAKGFFPDLVGGTERIFSWDNAPLAAIGFGTAALALTVDRRVSERYKSSTPLSDAAMKDADRLGTGAVEIGAGVALLGTGELINDKRMADAGAVSLEAFVVSGVFTETLKYATHRSRPNRGNNMSFPSGHAAVTATFSASISEMYDWNPWIAVPLYLTTAYVGLSRIQAQEHYLSDVIAGMTIGTLAGMSVGKYHKEKDQSPALKNITVVPIYDKDLRGGLVMVRF